MFLAQQTTWRPRIVRDLCFRGDGVSEGGTDKGTVTVLGAGGARVWRLPRGLIREYYGIICSGQREEQRIWRLQPHPYHFCWKGNLECDF